MVQNTQGVQYILLMHGMDTGPIIIQAVVKIKENDTEESLSKRILKEEHRIYSRSS